MSWFSNLAYPVRPHRGLLRSMVTLMDANRAITRDLPHGYLKVPHWRDAARHLLRAAASGADGDIRAATDALTYAIVTEGWMNPSEDPIESGLLALRSERRIQT